MNRPPSQPSVTRADSGINFFRHTAPGPTAFGASERADRQGACELARATSWSSRPKGGLRPIAQARGRRGARREPPAWVRARRGREPEGSRHRLHRPVPDPLAGPQGAVRGRPPGRSPALVAAGEDPPRSASSNFKRDADGGVQRHVAGRDRCSPPLSPVSGGTARSRSFLTTRVQRHRSAGLRAAGAWPFSAAR